VNVENAHIHFNQTEELVIVNASCTAWLVHKVGCPLVYVCGIREHRLKAAYGVLRLIYTVTINMA